MGGDWGWGMGGKTKGVRLKERWFWVRGGFAGG